MGSTSTQDIEELAESFGVALGDNICNSGDGDDECLRFVGMGALKYTLYRTSARVGSIGHTICTTWVAGTVGQMTHSTQTLSCMVACQALVRDIVF